MLALIIAITSTLLSLLTGIAVLMINWRRAANILYGLTSLAYIVLGVVNYYSTIASGDVKLWLARLVNVFTCLAIVFTYYLVVSLMSDKVITKHAPKSGVVSVRKSVVATAITIILCLTPLVISGVKGVAVSFGAGIIVFAAHLGYYGTNTVVMLLRSIFRRHLSGRVVAQARYLLVGFIPILLIAPVTGVYLPAAHNDLRFIMLTPAYSAFFVMMVSYAMVRQQLFDLRFYVVRFMIFGFTQVVLSIFYVTPIIYLAAWWMGISLSLSSLLILAFVFTVGAAFYGRIQKWFKRITNQLFFQDDYDAGALLSQINKGLVSVTDLEKMLTDTNRTLADALRLELSFFVLSDSDERKGYRIIGDRLAVDDVLMTVLRAANEGQESILLASRLDQNSSLLKTMVRHNISAVVRLAVDLKDDETVLAYLVLGPKKSGRAYSPIDLRTLSTVAASLIIAIQNALRFEEIEEFSVTLQKNVDDATRSLRRANEKLKAMDETKDDFISMASHQLRTPLTSIKGYVSMVLDGDMGEINEPQRQALNQALISSQRMVFLIADLLNLSRLKTGKFVIEPTPTKLSEIIESEVNQLQETAKARELELIYRKPAHFPVLMLDETKIRQVAMNFMDNAIYYTHSGGHIAVELKETEKTIEFTVTDDGIGVPKHEQPHLFNKFYRAGNARKARPDGTGLGLFMAKKVIVAQGGSIIFHSKEGKGSTFGFSFAKAKLIAPPNANPVFHESNALATAEKSLKA